MLPPTPTSTQTPPSTWSMTIIVFLVNIESSLVARVADSTTEVRAKVERSTAHEHSIRPTKMLKIRTNKERHNLIEIIVFREGGDIYNGDADAEEPEEGSKKRKKKVLNVD